jgi:hypothetical protein
MNNLLAFPKKERRKWERTHRYNKFELTNRTKSIRNWLRREEGTKNEMTRGEKVRFNYAYVFI